MVSRRALLIHNGQAAGKQGRTHCRHVLLGRDGVRFLATAMGRCVTVERSYKERPKQLPRWRSWSIEGGARDLPKKRDDDMQSVMKNRDAVPKKEVTKRQISDVRPIEEHPKTGSSTGQFEDQFKARLPHSRDEMAFEYQKEASTRRE